jgi:hypothetical protein
MSMIRQATLCEACACGQASVVEFLVDMESTDLDARGADGVSPLCAAATWGFDEIVAVLLDARCDPNVRNSDALASTALHVAANQEHGKIIMLLLQAGADATVEDAEGRTPCDFASVSDGMWPLFAARGLSRTPKEVLVSKRVIRKIDPAAHEFADATAGAATGTATSAGGGAGGGALHFYSRPGSAYVRSDAGALAPPAPRSPPKLPRVDEADPTPSVDVLNRMGSAGGDVLGGSDDEAAEGVLTALSLGKTTEEPTFAFWNDT